MENTAMTPNDYLDILKRRKWSLVLPAATIILLAAVVAFILPAVYRSEATIFIEEQEIPAEFVTNTVTSYVEQRIQTINQRIMRFARLVEIIKQFDLYPEMKDRYTTEEIVARMGSDTTLEPVSVETIDRRTGRPTTATIAFTLSYEGRDPQKVQQVTNVLASLFLQENIKQRVQRVEETSTFLETEKSRVKQELSELEAKISVYKQRHITELPEMMQVNLQSLNNIERNIETANQQQRSLKERAEYLQTQLASIDRYIEKEEERASRRRLEDLKVQLAALNKRFTDEYPDVKKLRAEISELEQQLAEASSSRSGPADNPAYITLASQLASTRSEIESIEQQIRKLNEDAAQYRGRLAATPGVEEEYRSLAAARNSTQAKYDDLVRKLMEAQVAQGLEKEQKGERFTMMEAPRLPEKPYKPNRAAIILIGIVLGIGAGVGFAALREFSDDAVRGFDALEGATELPVLAGIPEILTLQDIRRQRSRRVALAFGVVGAVVIGVIVFQFFVMDLDVFWAKLMRRLAL